MGSASPVLTFPLPAIAGGGNGTIGVKQSPEPEHVTLVFSSAMLNMTVTVPAVEAIKFADHVARVAIVARHPLAKVSL